MVEVLPSCGRTRLNAQMTDHNIDRSNTYLDQTALHRQSSTTHSYISLYPHKAYKAHNSIN